MSTLQPFCSMMGHSGRITCIKEVDSNGSIITTSTDGTVQLWSVTEERCLRTFANHDADYISLLDKATVLTVCDRTVHVWRVSDGRTLRVSDQFPHSITACAALGPITAILGDAEGNLFKIRWYMGRVDIIKKKIIAHNGPIKQLIACGDKFATLPESREFVLLWDASSMERFSNNIHCNHNSINCVELNSEFMVMGTHTGLFHCFTDERVGNGKECITSHFGNVKFLQISSEGDIVVSVGHNNVIALHNWKSKRGIAKYVVDSRMDLGLLLESGLLAVSNFDNHNITVYRIDELTRQNNEVADREQVTANFGRYNHRITLLETELASAAARIVNLDQIRNAQLVGAIDRITKLESSMKRLTIVPTEEPDACCVCLEQYDAGDEVFRLPCLHIHHTLCLLRSLKQQSEPKCPICRTVVPAEDIDNLPTWKWERPASSS